MYLYKDQNNLQRKVGENYIYAHTDSQSYSACVRACVFFSVATCLWEIKKLVFSEKEIFHGEDYCTHYLPIASCD